MAPSNLERLVGKATTARAKFSANSARQGNDAVHEIDFCTLGMFIIGAKDDIYQSPIAVDQTPKLNIIGGAGTYSALGGRLLSPPPDSRRIGWIIDAGTDFPTSIRDQISSWQTSALIRPRNALTTRGWNGYGANEHRAFKYLTEKKRLTAEDLSAESVTGIKGGNGLLGSRSFHLICSPTRCIELVQWIYERRIQAYGTDFPRPWIIWEPVPDLCVPDELERTLEAVKHVDVISPNHEELGALFGFEHPSSGDVDCAAVEEQVDRVLTSSSAPGEESSGAVVVRAGREGCFVAWRGKRKWLPAFHTDGEKVVDPTGGGNGFLGGFAVGLVRKGDMVEAARWGTIAASFCIEQVGAPVLSSSATSSDAGSVELWNGVSVFERLETYRAQAA